MNQLLPWIGLIGPIQLDKFHRVFGEKTVVYHPYSLFNGHMEYVLGGAV